MTGKHKSKPYRGKIPLPEYSRLVATYLDLRGYHLRHVAEWLSRFHKIGVIDSADKEFFTQTLIETPSPHNALQEMAEKLEQRYIKQSPNHIPNASSDMCSFLTCINEYHPVKGCPEKDVRDALACLAEIARTVLDDNWTQEEVAIHDVVQKALYNRLIVNPDIAESIVEARLKICKRGEFQKGREKFTAQQLLEFCHHSQRNSEPEKAADFLRELERITLQLCRDQNSITPLGNNDESSWSADKDLIDSMEKCRELLKQLDDLPIFTKKLLARALQENLIKNYLQLPSMLDSPSTSTTRELCLVELLMDNTDFYMESAAHFDRMRGSLLAKRHNDLVNALIEFCRICKSNNIKLAYSKQSRCYAIASTFVGLLIFPVTQIENQLKEAMDAIHK